RSADDGRRAEARAARLGESDVAVSGAVVVAGGASGIGRASARAVAAQGRDVALWDLQGDVAVAEAKAIADEHGVKAHGLGFDATDTASFARAIDATKAAVGSIGGLVHAAGTVRTETL